MIEVTATEASRRFADLLDGVEHRSECYTIVRRGRVIAQLTPPGNATGAEAKALLRRHRVDADWLIEVEGLRSNLVAEDRM